MTDNQVVKLIDTAKYEISITGGKTHGYYVRYVSKYNNLVVLSNLILDYKIASYMFDLKLNSLELH